MNFNWNLKLESVGAIFAIEMEISSIKSCFECSSQMTTNEIRKACQTMEANVNVHFIFAQGFPSFVDETKSNTNIVMKMSN